MQWKIVLTKHMGRKQHLFRNYKFCFVALIVVMFRPGIYFFKSIYITSHTLLTFSEHWPFPRQFAKNILKYDTRLIIYTYSVQQKREIPFEKVEINTKIRKINTKKREFPLENGKLTRKKGNSLRKSGN